MKIGFVTCPEAVLGTFFPTLSEPDFRSPEPLFTPDDYLAVLDLRAHGHHVEGIIWNTPPTALLDFDMVIVRSPWDYTDSDTSKQAFLDWISELDAYNIPIANPAALMNWLLDKHYLQDFAALGSRIIPTVYHNAGSNLNLVEIFNSQGAFVLKPCVSAGGVDLYLIDNPTAATQYQEVVNQKMRLADYMLQPLIPEITTRGEWSVIFLGGKYSHAILKKPAVNSILVHAERGGSLHVTESPSSVVKDFANEVYLQLLPALLRATGISLASSSVLYLRVDIIETTEGPVLVECEGVEPELFFRAKPGSEALFREALEETVMVD